MYAYFFSDFCVLIQVLLLTVTLRGVSNKHCLLPLFSLHLSIIWAKNIEDRFFLDCLTIVNPYKPGVVFTVIGKQNCPGCDSAKRRPIWGYSVCLYEFQSKK